MGKKAWQAAFYKDFQLKSFEVSNFADKADYQSQTEELLQIMYLQDICFLLIG